MSAQDSHTPEVEQIVQAILKSPKYRHVCPELIAWVTEGEIAKGRRPKDAAHEARNKLHQVGGAFFTGRPKYSSWERELGEAFLANDREKLLSATSTMLSFHASTRERLPILDSFYQRIFAETGTPRTILDLACGLNPLTLPWMGLDSSVKYLACDIYADMVSFLNRYFALAGINGAAQVRDLLSSPPGDTADVAFAFKVLPTLEQIDQDSGIRLIEGLDARNIVVTFPIRSLGGRNKSMSENYSARFTANAEKRGWRFSRIDLGAEVAFIVHKSD